MNYLDFPVPGPRSSSRRKDTWERVHRWGSGGESGGQKDAWVRRESVETQTGEEKTAARNHPHPHLHPSPSRSDRSDAASTAATLGDQDGVDSDNHTVDSSSGVDESADTGSALSVTSLPQRAQRPQVSRVVAAL